MELRNYWRVLVRRRLVLRNTVLIVALLSLITVAYSYYGALYEGHAIIDLEVQPPNVSKNVNYDPHASAQGLSGNAVTEITNFAAGNQYFKNVSTELYGNQNHWKALQQSTKGIYQVPNSHEIYIRWDGNNTSTATRVVRAELHQLMNYVPEFQRAASMPKISVTQIDPPTAQRISLTKPLLAFLERVAVGIVLAIILAYLFEYLDDSVQDETDVRHWMHVPTLAVIPGGRQARRARSA